MGNYKFFKAYLKNNLRKNYKNEVKITNIAV